MTEQYIVFGTDDPSYVPHLGEANVFTGKNSFTSNVSATSNVYLNTVNCVSTASLAVIKTNTINCYGYYQASGVTGYSGTFALASVATIIVTSGLITGVV